MPTSRIGHTAFMYKKAMYIFGGFISSKGYTNELIRFDIQSQ